MVQEFINPHTGVCQIFDINPELRAAADRHNLEALGLRAGTDYYWYGDDMVLISGKAHDQTRKLMHQTMVAMGWDKLPKDKTLFGHKILNL
jgi:hypothetical protein